MTIRVSSQSRTSGVAHSIVMDIRNQKYAEIRARGAGSINQTLKGIILANEVLAKENIRVAFQVEFVGVLMEDKPTVTAVRFIVDPQ